MKPIRIAIIGYGKIAADQHLPAIRGDDRFELVATVSPRGPGIEPLFQSHTDMLKAIPDLDAVAITTPPSVRYAIARDCIAAGLHCFLEKPPTVTLGEIQALERQAASQSVSLFTSWHAQHHPAVEQAAQLLTGQTITSMDIRWHEDVTKWHPGQAWIWQAGGFGVFDPGINAFSIATRIFPGPLFVRSATLAMPEGAATPIAVEAQFDSPAATGPLSVSLDWRRTHGEDWTIRLTTQVGTTIELRDGGSALWVDGQCRSTPGRGEYPELYARFADLVATGKSQVDIEPLRLVADCLLVGDRQAVAAPPS